MTIDEFSEKYCKTCGTQRCMGVDDEDWREGCTKYQKYILGKEPLNIQKLVSVHDNKIVARTEKLEDLFKNATYREKVSRDAIEEVLKALSFVKFLDGMQRPLDACPYPNLEEQLVEEIYQYINKPNEV